MSIVGITQATYDDVHEKIQVALERGDFNLKNGEHVVIKINLCDFRMPDTGAVTHPIFLDATLNYLRSSLPRLKIVVVESDASAAQPDLLVKWLGLKPIIEKHGAQYLNLSKSNSVSQPIDGYFLKKMKVPQIILDTDCLITMPKLKTHLLTKITCCLKNQFGCIPITRKVKYHPNLDSVIVDACRAMKPDFCVVDGILGLGGVKGPTLGRPIPAHVIVTGRDPVAVDTVCSKIMGFHPHLISHIRKAQSAGIGKMAYTVVGEALDSVQTDFNFNPFYRFLLKSALALKSKA